MDRIQRLFGSVEFVHLKCHYFFLNGALACIIPFLPLFSKELGISAFTTGLILSPMPFLSVIAKPLTGAIADRTKRLERIIQILLLFITVAASILILLHLISTGIDSRIVCSPEGTVFFYENNRLPDCDAPKFPNSFQHRCYLTCTDCYLKSELSDIGFRNLSVEPNCQVHKTMEVIMYMHSYSNETEKFNVTSLTASTREMNLKCGSNLYLACYASCQAKIQKCFESQPIYVTSQFWLFIVSLVLIYSSSGPINSLSDTACFNALKNRPQLYGKQRLWGTIGWGIFAAIAGAINVITSTEVIPLYARGFCAAIPLITIDCWLVVKIKRNNMVVSKNILKDMGQLLKQFRIVMFLISVFIIGISTGLLWSYLFWHLHTLSGTALLFGLVSGVQCLLGELPFFYFAGHIISKLGHVNVLTVALTAFGIRFVCYSYLQNPWWVLPIELLQGPTFGLFYTTLASYANVAALPGTEATMQGLVGAAFEGLGVAVGNLLGGITMHKLGGSQTFFWAGVIMLIYSPINGIFGVYFTIQDRKGRQTPNNIRNSGSTNVNETSSFIVNSPP